MDSSITADTIRYSIMGFILLQSMFEIYICLRQIKMCKNSDTVPRELQKLISEEIFHKSRIYGLEVIQFGMYYKIFTEMLLPILAFYVGSTALIWHRSEDLADRLNFDSSSEVVVSCFFRIIMTVSNLVIEIPFEIYKDFVLEKRYGFNRKTVIFFIIDKIMQVIVDLVITLPIVATTVFIIQNGGSHMVIWLWLCSGFVTLFLISIYPIFIAPLFDKFTPLEDGPLKQSIEELAASVKFPLSKIYVLEGSQRSAHTNAYFCGFWKSKRIVLYDTILPNRGKQNIAELLEEERGKGCTDKEILAIMGHELGHWKLGHITKSNVINQVYIFTIFAAFGYLFQYGPLYEAVGFEPGKKPLFIGLLVVMTYVMAPYNALYRIVTTMLSQRFEYQADEFSYKMGFFEQLVGGLAKIHADNFSFPMGDWLFILWNRSHPTLLQRVNRLNELNEERKAK